MKQNFSKGRLKKSLLTGVLTALALTVAMGVPAQAAEDLSLSNEHFQVKVGEYGQISELKIQNDLFPTNYVMNKENSPKQNTTDHQWMGELMFQTKLADASVYTESTTNQSDDARTIKKVSDSKISVTYENSSKAKGIKDFKLEESYSLVEDYLYWEMTVTNTKDKTLTFGDFGVPLAFTEIWDGGGEIYETRVIDHSFVGKNSSYIYVTRPSGMGPLLMMTPDASTGAGFEYQDHWVSDEGRGNSWSQDTGNWANGLNVFYIHSDVIKKTGRGYLENTTLTLQPGESKTYAFKFFAARNNAEVNTMQENNALKNEGAMKDILYKEGIIDAVALPGMVFASDMNAKLDLHANLEPSQIENIEIKCPHDSHYHENVKTCTLTHDCTKAAATSIDFLEKKTIDGQTHLLYDVKLSCWGQNDVTITYDGGKETTLQFYILEPVNDALNRHGDFMVEKTQWDAPGKFYDKVFDDWMMDTKSKRGEFKGYWGWGDDWGLTHGEYLAEKNVFAPDAKQIKAVDEYLDVAIWNSLMKEHQEDYLIHDFLMAEPNDTPTYRGYAYPHIYNTYFSMYRIAVRYPEIIDYVETADTYLLRAYSIMKALYGPGVSYNFATGLMGELTTPEIIDSLEKEGYTAEAQNLRDIMLRKYNNFKNTKYPYGSEYAYDNTGEEAVYTLAKMQGNKAMMEKIDWKTRACRGIQPVWYHYGNPTTICGENWWNFQYTAALAGYCMDDWLRLQDESKTVSERAYAQRVNYAGKLANLTCINSGQICGDPENVGTVAWTYQMEKGVKGGKGTGGGNLHNGWRQMAGEADLGLFGVMRILSADVATDPVFGLFGYGCQVTDNGASYTVVPKDGLYKRLNLLDEQIYLEFARDQYASATIQKDKTGASFVLTNLTGTTHCSEATIYGLKAGTYEVVADGTVIGAFTATDKQAVAFNVPVSAASVNVELRPVDSAPANTAPVVDSGKDFEGIHTQKQQLIGSAADYTYPGVTMNYNWTVVSAPENAVLTFDNAQKPITKIKASVGGVYVLKLTASDGELTGENTITFTAIQGPDNAAPVVNAGEDFEINRSKKFTLTGSATDDGYPDNQISFAWSVKEAPEGGSIAFTSPTAAVTVAKASKVGTYVVELAVSDGELIGIDTVTITIIPDPEQPKVLASYTFETLEGGKFADMSGRGKDARSFNTTIVDGKKGKSVKLSGSNSYVQLADNLMENISDVTVAFDVKMGNTASNYTRLFDFGEGSSKYMALWFSSRNRPFFAMTVNGNGNEQQIPASSTSLPVGQWAHVAVTLQEDIGIIYMNGKEVSRSTKIALDPTDLGAITKLYIGKSQFSDPYLNAEIDNFEIRSYAMTGQEITDTYMQTEPAYMTGVRNADTTTIVGSAPILPATVLADYDDGSILAAEVVWDAIDPANYATAGKFDVTGTVTTKDKNGQTVTFHPILHVTVLEGFDDFLAAKYDFDATNGKAVSDVSGGGHDGEIKGTFTDAVYVDGLNGSKAAQFTSANQTYLEIPASDAFHPKNITVSTWLRRTKNLTGETIIAWGKGDWNTNGWFVNSNPDVPVGMYVDGGVQGFTTSGTTQNEFFPLNEWVQLTITFNSETNVGSIYRNGVKQPSVNNGNPDSISPSGKPILIGKNYYGAIMHEYDMDNFRVYGTDLPEIAVAQMYNKDLTVQPGAPGVIIENISNISGKAGTQFTLPVVLTAFPKGDDFRAIEGIVTVPAGMKIAGITPTLALNKVEFDSNLDGTTLRFAFVSTGETSISFEGGKLLDVTFELTEDKAPGETLPLEFARFLLKDSNFAETEFDLTQAKSDVTVAEVEITADAKELFVSDNSDVIPAGKKAVSVVFTGVDAAAKVLFSGVPFYYSPDRSAVNNQVVFVAMVNETVTIADLNNADSYTITDEKAPTVVFGDVNASGEINAQDALVTVSAWLRKGNAPTEAEMLSMNVNADGAISTADAIAIVDWYVSAGVKEFIVVTK